MKNIMCHIAVLWHSHQNMLPSHNILAMEYTPVVYYCGQGLYSISSYLTYVDGDAYLILDNVFTITKGTHPLDGVAVLCDAVKDAIQTVISKSIAIIGMESESTPIVTIDKFDQSEHIPEQLVEITKWTHKKLIIDFNAKMSEEPINRNAYFQDHEGMSTLSSYIIKWDQYHTISREILSDLIDILSKMDIREDQLPILESIVPNINHLSSELDTLKQMIQQKIHN